MRTSIWKLTAVMLLGILSFSSCGDDDDAGAQGQDLVINLNKEHEVVEIDKTIQLVAGFSPSDAPNKAHTWTSENPQIATVDETGKVKGVSVGTTRITVTALANKATATCEIEVVDKIIAVTSVTLNSKEETISIGSTTQLTATVSPTTATDQNVVWTSSNNSVAIVNEDGLVKGLSVGSANITASAGGKSAVCAVTVTEKSVDFSNIRFTVQADGSLLVSGTVKSVGVNVSEIGACFSTETNPTIEHNKHVLTTTGLIVNSEISDLAPNSYYTRLYAKEGNTIYYGTSMIVKVPEKFSTQFKLVKNYRYCSYTSRNLDNGTAVTRSSYKLTISTPKVEEYSNINLCYGLAPTPEITDNIVNLSTNTAGDLQVTLTNLSEGTKYYVRAYGLKDGKPVYYPGETSFTTIGKETKLDIKYVSSGSGYYYFGIFYTLPEQGTYEVSVTPSYGHTWIRKSESGEYSKLLYVENGEGSFSYKMELQKGSSSSTYNNHNLSYLKFHNIETGTDYEMELYY